MNCKFTNVLMFAAGAVIGSAVTWKVLKTKYEQIVQEEIESVKEAFSGMSEHNEQATDETEESEDEEDEQVEEHHHVDWSELEDLDEDDEETLEEYERLTIMYSNEEGGAEKMKPYVIDPYDFGEKDGYSQFSLTYYADGVLEDEDHKIVKDVDDLIGLDSLDTFGKYEDDSVFVRNDRLRADFEILKDYRKYSDLYPDGPSKVGNE